MVIGSSQNTVRSLEYIIFFSFQTLIIKQNTVQVGLHAWSYFSCSFTAVSPIYSSRDNIRHITNRIIICDFNFFSSMD